MKYTVVGMEETEDRLVAEAARGLLGVCVLAVLAHQEAHGYAVAVRLGEIGLARVRAGAVYPVLTRLEEEGALQARWTEGQGGPGRKVYRATAAGRERLTVAADQLVRRAGALAQLVRAGTGTGAGEDADEPDLPVAAGGGR